MKIFTIRKFWQNERPSSTESETESTESEAKVKISSREPMIKNVATVKNLDLTHSELKSEIRKLEYQLERSETSLQNQENLISQLTTKNEIVSNKNVRHENEFATARSRINHLESEIRRYKYEQVKYEVDFQGLKDRNTIAQSRINHLESEIRRYKYEKVQYEADFQGQKDRNDLLEERYNTLYNTLIKRELLC